MTTGNGKKRLILWWAMNLGFAVLFIAMFRGAWDELFVYEPGVSYPRIETPYNTGGAVSDVRFTLNIPTVGSLAVTAASILGIGLGIQVAVHLWRRNDLRRVKKCFLGMVLILSVQVVAWLIVCFDFFSSAGSFG